MPRCDYGSTPETPSPCEREAQFKAVLLVRAAAGVKPNEVEIDWFTCNRHGKVATVDDIVTSDGWEFIMLDHKRHGRIPPAKAHTSLRFKRL